MPNEQELPYVKAKMPVGWEGELLWETMGPYWSLYSLARESSREEGAAVSFHQGNLPLHLDWAFCVSGPVTYIIIVEFYGQPMQWVGLVLFFLFFQWKDWSSEELKKLSKVLEIGDGYISRFLVSKYFPTHVLFFKGDWGHLGDINDTKPYIERWKWTM